MSATPRRDGRRPRAWARGARPNGCRRESLEVDRIVSGYWRLRRLGQVEAGIFVWEGSEERAERAEREAGQYEKLVPLGAGTMFDHEPELVITDEEKRGEALERASRMRGEQEDETATLGRTFARDADRANAFSKLSRYETGIDRGIDRALDKLRKLQAARRAGDGATPPALTLQQRIEAIRRAGGGDATPPGVIDVDASGVSGDGP